MGLQGTEMNHKHRFLVVVTRRVSMPQERGNGIIMLLGKKK
jgi:hypothetical protein